MLIGENGYYIRQAENCYETHEKNHGIFFIFRVSGVNPKYYLKRG